MASPTQLSLKKLRSDGYLNVAITERWNPYSRTRHDLWGFADLVAIVPHSHVLAVQCTSMGNVSHRLTKMRSEPVLAQILACLQAGVRVEIHGWGKRPLKLWSKVKRWTAKIIELGVAESGDDLCTISK